MIVFMMVIMYMSSVIGSRIVKVSREQVSENKMRVLNAAGRLFRERGFDNVTLAEIMKAAGLTHGAFYGHFPSKEALAAEAIGFAVTPAPAAKPKPAAEYADNYLSIAHRDNRAGGCSFAGLGTEVARGSEEMRHAMTEAVERQIQRFADASPGKTAQEKRRAGILAWSAMVGAVMLSRIADDKKLSEEILTETRKALPLA
jgi:TetR/AcrR family transcriptional repressor of nem operon